MIFYLLEDLFAAPLDEALLLGLVRHGATGRHKIRTTPGFRTGSPRAVHDWLATLSPNLRRTAVLAFDNGQQSPSYKASDEPQFKVGPFTESLWTTRPERDPSLLTLADAHDLAARPLHLLLENSRNDFAFLGKIVPPSWRDRWDRALSNRWVEPLGGGIDEMRKVIEQRLAGDSMRRLTSFAVFDSDARLPGVPSESALRNRATCERHGVCFHQLERRAIENYLPKEALFDWAHRPPRRSVREDRRARVGAYVAMQPAARRHHYNLKEGFNGDQRGNHSLSTLYTAPYEGHDPVSRPSALEDGIDRDIMQIWRESDYSLSEAALLSEGFERERTELFQSLFGRA